jgi:hypothetical protein
VRTLCDAFVDNGIERADTIDIRVSETNNSASWSAWCGDELLFTSPRTEQLVSDLEWWLCNEAVSRAVGCVHIHAGSIARGGEAIVLPGKSGVGKSTLTVASLSRGFDVLTDDVTLVSRTDRLVLPFLRSFHLDGNAIGLLRHLDISIPPFEGELRTFSPSQFGVKSRLDPAKLRALVFLDRRDGDSGTLQVIDQARAILMLLPHCSLRDEPASRHVDDVARLVSGCQCFQLASGNVHRALDALAVLGDQLSDR